MGFELIFDWFDDFVLSVIEGCNFEGLSYVVVFEEVEVVVCGF